MSRLNLALDKLLILLACRLDQLSCDLFNVLLVFCCVRIFRFSADHGQFTLVDIWILLSALLLQLLLIFIIQEALLTRKLGSCKARLG